jgi:peptide/nickel transport system ATP-binding protein
MRNYMDTADRVEPANVIEIDDLHISYETRKGDVEAIQGVSFTVREGETVGLVGESGCGKSTIAFGIVNFLGPNGKIVDGSIRFQDNELVGRSQEELKQLRGDRIAMVFQDPMQALNPSVRLGEQLAEVLTCHHADIDQAEAWQRSIDMLKRVNMPDVEDVMKRYSHQISGGQQQRVVIAMAMLNNPALLIMDEPTTALDVTVEAAVLDLIEELKQEFNAANIFITHNPQGSALGNPDTDVIDGFNKFFLPHAEQAVATHPGTRAAAGGALQNRVHLCTPLQLCNRGLSQSASRHDGNHRRAFSALHLCSGDR